MGDLTLHIVTPSGDQQDVSLTDALRALPKNKQLMVHFSPADNKVIANFGGGAVASGDDPASAIEAAYNLFLQTVQIENPQRKLSGSYVQPDLRRRPLAGETIPWGSLPSHVRKREVP